MNLVVIPCLNEARYLESLITQLRRQGPDMLFVIAEGGSIDGSREIAEQLAAVHENVICMPNPKRLQSAGVNLAVAQYGKDAEYLIRIDAHADYPEDYCEKLLAEARATGADSVVTSIDTIDHGGFQKAVAAAQNSVLGNGGSAHRSSRAEGRWVEHGHHSLMRLKAFRAVGGYDESFSHNEDAELDLRLCQAGYTIWLTAATMCRYYPRASALPLLKQYRNYGRGRIRTLLKHHGRPKLRQMAPVAIVPATLLAFAAPVSWLAAAPLLTWAMLCMGYGAYLALKRQEPIILLSGPAAMIMHAGWSLGFWQGLFHYRTGEAS